MLYSVHDSSPKNLSERDFMKKSLSILFVGFFSVGLIAQDFTVSRAVGTDLAKALFDSIDSIIQKLSVEKKQMIEKIKREQEQSVRLLADPVKQKEISQFLREAAELEVQNEETVGALLEKYPVMKSVQGSGLLTDFVFGIAQVLVDKSGIAEDEALAVAQKLAEIFLNLQG